MEGRMTLCNMAIEMGAKPVWLHRTKPPLTMSKAVCMAERQRFRRRHCLLENPANRRGATFDTVVTLQAEEISPQVTGAPIPAR